MEEEIIRIFEETRAILKGHFIYTSGKHGEVYVNKDSLYMFPLKVKLLCERIAEHFKDKNIEIVAGPAIGGVVLTQWTAFTLTQFSGKDILAIYSEDGPNNTKIFKRGYDKCVKGKRILVVEDITTTGGSVQKTVDAVKALDGIVVGVGFLWNRGAITSQDLGVPEVFSLVNITFEAFDEEECPLCAQKVQINTDVGKGRQYLAQKAQ
ncbi:MAG: phosphoribosyltransferase family protein [Candidatus Nealsonbacteria bacterium]